MISLDCTCLENFKLNSRKENKLTCKAKIKDHVCMCSLSQNSCLSRHKQYDSLENLGH